MRNPEDPVNYIRWPGANGGPSMYSLDNGFDPRVDPSPGLRANPRGAARMMRMLRYFAATIAVVILAAILF